MPTEKQIEQQLKREELAGKKDLVTRVMSAALHMLHESDFYGSNLWPKKGFSAGYGIGKPNDDTFYIGVNAYGWNKQPVIGRLGINIHSDKPRRVDKQITQIDRILDQSLYDGIYFENEFNNIRPDDKMWFKFTINK